MVRNSLRSRLKPGELQVAAACVLGGYLVLDIGETWTEASFVLQI